MEEISQLIASDLQSLEQSIEKLLTTRVSFIKEVVHHIVKSGGKRIRPILVILAARLCGCQDERHVPYAAIVEFIHTATLLHDDVVDNARTRRGTLTANTIWGNEPSVLVGDFLFSKSFDLMVADGIPDVIGVISKATTALAEGEILELIKTSDVETTEADYAEIIANKTAVLLSAACEIGAILGCVDIEKRTALREFGYHVGMAFQLTDDMLDYISSDTTLGKHTGTDLREGKITLPLIHALKEASDEEKNFVSVLLEKPRITKKDFEQVKKTIEAHDGMGYTLRCSVEHIEKAKRQLEVFSPSDYKTALLNLADYIVSRRM
jgi:octaprenyl-diphosphate synthase